MLIFKADNELFTSNGGKWNKHYPHHSYYLVWKPFIVFEWLLFYILKQWKNYIKEELEKQYKDPFHRPLCKILAECLQPQMP